MTLLCCTTFTATAFADTLTLHNGKILQGSFEGRSGEAILFSIDGIEITVPTKDVKSIDMNQSNAVATKPASVAAAAPGTAQAKESDKGYEIAAGSQLTIKMQQTLDSGKHASGHKFTAVLEGALMDGDQTIVAAGSTVYGVITEAKKARRIAGKAKIMLTLTDIKINGHIVPIKANVLNATAEATGKNTASKVVRGAAIGGLVNGSDGAKDGAKVGVGVALLSKGNQVVIPSGTLLDFQLTNSLKS